VSKYEGIVFPYEVKRHGMNPKFFIIVIRSGTHENNLLCPHDSTPLRSKIHIRDFLNKLNHFVTSDNREPANVSDFFEIQPCKTLPKRGLGSDALKRAK
jgi:hypothetical protein